MAANRRKRVKKSPVDDVDKIYLCNLNFVPPKDQNLETIFEEPRETKDGTKVLTSKIKYKRYLNFDPTVNKIQKRKRKAKKCTKKLRTSYRVTRSMPETAEQDMSLCIDILEDSSNDSDVVNSVPISQTCGPSRDDISDMTVQDASAHSEADVSNKDVDTPQASATTDTCYHDIKSKSFKSPEAKDELPKSPCTLS